MSFTLPQLPYEIAALEPYYSRQTLEIHWGKHHQAYTDKFNAAVSAAGMEGKSAEEVLTSLDSISEDKRAAVRNQGGGYWNHTFFWHCMKPNTDDNAPKPMGKIAEEINKQFGSFDDFKAKFSEKATAHFGSGWAWLVINKEGNLEITDTHDQVCPITFGHTPLFTIDVWEHAYYLQFQNRRPEWIEIYWKLANWEKVEERFVSA